MIPLPTLVFNQLVFPLQLLASRAAEWALMFIGIPVLREGNILELAGQRLAARCPDAQTWVVRVGSPYVRRFGTHTRRAAG